jgi:hypothetical protein
MLEASRSIAQQWLEDRKNGVKNIPEGTQEELEGKLVEHAITICDQLEAELKQKSEEVGDSAKEHGVRLATHRRNGTSVQLRSC